MSKKDRARLARDRKAALRRAGYGFSDLAQAARASYSLAEKWMNARRNSPTCADAFARLIGAPR